MKKNFLLKYFFLFVMGEKYEFVNYAKDAILSCVITAYHTVKQTLVALYSPQEFNYINDCSTSLSWKKDN